MITVYVVDHGIWKVSKSLDLKMPPFQVTVLKKSPIAVPANMTRLLTSHTLNEMHLEFPDISLNTCSNRKNVFQIFFCTVHDSITA